MVEAEELEKRRGTTKSFVSGLRKPEMCADALAGS